ncbi:uncharacterized protein J4E78_008966 [Alternaria triticimaculans]|uniref:uncharacterized protein n=1 Tax=Alternaria triticimaculans TaxID=297637 RepID=UPI0020C4AB13|nr:uncharacterized protein J4E78_008966 [Alternaria triticimaculans]KAI4647650.1 hypothetical protein J4E78_008966 [Alternaria triticimaculans]
METADAPSAYGTSPQLPTIPQEPEALSYPPSPPSNAHQEHPTPPSPPTSPPLIVIHPAPEPTPPTSPTSPFPESLPPRPQPAQNGTLISRLFKRAPAHPDDIELGPLPQSHPQETPVTDAEKEREYRRKKVLFIYMIWGVLLVLAICGMVVGAQMYRGKVGDEGGGEKVNNFEVVDESGEVLRKDYGIYTAISYAARPVTLRKTDYNEDLDSFYDYNYGDFNDDENSSNQYNHFYGRHNTYKSSKFNKVASVPPNPPTMSYEHHLRHYKVNPDTFSRAVRSIVCLVFITALVLVTSLLPETTISSVKLMGFLLVKTALILLNIAIFLLKISCKILFHLILAVVFRR